MSYTTIRQNKEELENWNSGLLGWYCEHCKGMHALIIGIEEVWNEYHETVWKVDKDGEEYPSDKQKMKVDDLLLIWCPDCGEESEQWADDDD